MKTGGNGDRLAQSLIIFSIGFFVLLAQTLLFRDFLAVYEGNELGIGCFFSAWLLWVGVGAWIGRLPGRWLERATEHFDLLVLLYPPAFILQQQLIAGSRALAGIQAFEHFEFIRMFPTSILANAPVSVLSGFLFTRACDWIDCRHSLPVARVYMIESLGSFAGGLAVTLLLARGVSSEFLFLSVSILLLMAVAFSRRTSRMAWVLLAGVLTLAGSMGFRLDRRWTRYNEQHAWERLLPSAAFQGSFTTPQARYLFGEYQGQFNVLSCESVAETVPNDEHASEVLALSLSQHPAGRRILLFGPDTYSIARRWLSLPQVESVCWIHPDPDYPRKLLAALPPELKGGSDRLVIPSCDLRAYLATTDVRYDTVLLNVPDAATLSLNRYLTVELFQQVKRCLTENGVVGVRVAGGENFMGDERMNLGATVYATMKKMFGHMAVKPGDETWLLASDGRGLSEDARVLRQRFQTVPEAASLYPSEGLSVLYPADRIDFQKRQYDGIIAGTRPELLLNSDRQPKSVLLSLLLVARMSGLSGHWLDLLRRASLCGTSIMLVGLLLYPLLRWIYLLQGSRGSGPRSRRTDVLVLVSTVGFAGMSFSILLMFMYQSRFGTIFLHIGLFSALFMLGLFLGSFLCNDVLKKIGDEPRWLLPILIAAQLLLYAFVMRMPGRYVFFAGYFLLGGGLGGAFIPVAAFRLKSDGFRNVGSGSRIEAFDHLGGTLGSLASGWVLLPLLGIAAMPVILGGVVLANLPACWRFEWTGHRSRSDRLIHAMGYLLFGLCVVLLFASATLRSTSAIVQASPLDEIAREWWTEETVERHSMPVEGNPAAVYFSATKADSGERAYLFNSADWSAGIPGHGGPIPLAVMTDAEGALLKYRILSSHETPAYLQRTLSWQKQLVGKNIFSDPPLAGVDTVSGATQTSRALLETLRESGRAFHARVLEGVKAERESAAVRYVPDKESIVLLLFLAAALCLRIKPSIWARRLFLLIVLLVVGVWLNLQFSMDEVLTLLSGHLPHANAGVAFLLTVAMPVLVLLVGNVYCGYLCPFGAVQELIGELRPRWIRLNPDKKTWRYARMMKFVLLALFAVVIAAVNDPSVVAHDPLVVVFGGAMEKGLWVFVLFLLGLSLFYDRFWCRNLCPAGAFLGLLGRWRVLRAILPRIVPGRCRYGVIGLRNLDCLECDRCRMSFPTDEASPVGHRRERHAVFFVCVAIGALFLAGHTLRLSNFMVSPSESVVTPLREPPLSSGKIRNVDINRIQGMIDRKKLSGHEALYYSPAGSEEDDHEENVP